MSLKSFTANNLRELNGKPERESEAQTRKLIGLTRWKVWPSSSAAIGLAIWKSISKNMNRTKVGHQYEG